MDAGLYTRLLRLMTMSLARLFASRSGSFASEKYEALLKNASDGIHILDENGFLLEASNQFHAMLGYSYGEMLGMHVSQWDAIQSAVEFRELISQQLSLAKPLCFETRHRRKDGTIIDVEITGMPVQIQGKWVLYNSARNITERKAMELALQQSLEHQQRLTKAGYLLDSPYPNMLCLLWFITQNIWHIQFVAPCASISPSSKAEHRSRNSEKQ
jgi:PAS domain S-box-containing protein